MFRWRPAGDSSHRVETGDTPSHWLSVCQSCQSCLSIFFLLLETLFFFSVSRSNTPAPASSEDSDQRESDRSSASPPSSSSGGRSWQILTPAAMGGCGHVTSTASSYSTTPTQYTPVTIATPCLHTNLVGPCQVVCDSSRWESGSHDGLSCEDSEGCRSWIYSKYTGWWWCGTAVQCCRLQATGKHSMTYSLHAQ